MAKVTLVNPTRRRKAAQKRVSAKPAPAKRRKRTNPGTLTVLGLTNPTKGKTMQKTKKKKNPAPKRRARKNPAVVSFKKSTHRRRRNPSMIGQGVSTIKAGVLALIGLVATRQLPQMALGAKNTGALGYVANFAAMLLASAAASKVAGKPAGQSVAIGGGLYIANRVISENFSPIGKALSLSGLGDAQAASGAQLRGIQPAYFPVPVTYENGAAQVPQLIRDEIRAAVPPAPPASKMAGYRMAA
jgi:hypothetical protein